MRRSAGDRPLEAPRIPSTARPLVGRETELVAVVARLTDSETRVVAITGPIGVGKSRLARAAVERAGLDRVITVDARECASRAELEDAVAAALDVHPDVRSGAMRALDAAGDVLVVVDGLDRLAGAVAQDDLDESLAPWLDEAPNARFLVTRRARVASSFAFHVPLGPLATPARDVLEGPAADLLLACVRRARPAYAPTAADARFLAELLRELDGLPLAIELAAPRLDVMGPAALLHRLRSGAAALGGARSLEAAMMGAWQALPAAERDALTMLSVFPGGFTIDAAEDVLDRVDAVPLVESLCGRSLLESHPADGEVRLSMLRTLRELVIRQGDAAVRSSAIVRHARHYADVAEQWHQEQRSHTPLAARRALLVERDNLVAVIESVLDGGPIDKRRAEPALRALVALFPAHGEAPPARYLAILRPTIEATHDSGADPLLVARAHLVAGAAHRTTGDRATATRDLTRALHIATTLGATALEGEAMLELARLLVDADEIDQAHAHAVQALRRFVDRGLRAEEASALVVFAEIARTRGELAAAHTAADRAIALFSETRDRVGATAARHVRSRVVLDEARYDELDAEADSDVVEEGDRVRAALHRAWARHAAGDLEVAATIYGSLDERARACGLAELEALVLGSMAAMAMERREISRAHALFRAARVACAGRRFRSFASFSALGAVVDATLTPELGDAPIDADPVASCVRRLVGAPTAWSDVDAELRRLSATRLFARLALRALGPDARTRVQERLPDDALVIGAGGRWFRMPGATMVDLERRKPLARILDRLAEAPPGELVPRDALQSAGWPGERIAPAAAAHRVRVAIATLRKLGLTGALLTRDDGYLLDASCRMLRGG